MALGPSALRSVEKHFHERSAELICSFFRRQPVLAYNPSLSFASIQATTSLPLATCQPIIGLVLACGFLVRFATMLLAARLLRAFCSRSRMTPAWRRRVVCALTLLGSVAAPARQILPPCDQAQQMRELLEASPEPQRTRGAYDRVLDAYRTVYHNSPGAPKADARSASGSDGTHPQGLPIRFKSDQRADADRRGFSEATGRLPGFRAPANRLSPLSEYCGSLRKRIPSNLSTTGATEVGGSRRIPRLGVRLLSGNRMAGYGSH